jgi:hypothetical protein
MATSLHQQIGDYRARGTLQSVDGLEHDCWLLDGASFVFDPSPYDRNLSLSLYLPDDDLGNYTQPSFIKFTLVSGLVSVNTVHAIGLGSSDLQIFLPGGTSGDSTTLSICGTGRSLPFESLGDERGLLLILNSFHIAAVAHN